MKYLFLFLAISLPARAGTTVIYFGGYGASSKDMKCWEQGAHKSREHSAYVFKGVSFPAGAGAGKASAVQAGASVIADIVSEIDSHPGEKYVLVGHSSGAALSNEVGSRIKNPKQAELVNLDGFAPSAALQARVKTTCVYAENPKSGLQSRNAGSMKGNCKNTKAVQNSQCLTDWCLHFAVVNSEVPPALSGGNFKQAGYEGCATNLSWLPGKRLAQPDQALEEKGTSAQ